ncbi:MAG: hypothetical protein B7Z26_11280, partial [Asticcacaulis sp. 32-58-5]
EADIQKANPSPHEPAFTSQADVLEGLGALLISPFILIPPFIVLRQIFHWLRSGTWERWPLSRGLDLLGIPLPATDWVGAQGMIDWTLALPLALAIPLTGILGFFTLLLAIVLFRN